MFFYPAPHRAVAPARARQGWGVWVGLAALILLSSCSSAGLEQDNQPASVAAETAQSEGQANVYTYPVYWVGNSGETSMLFREFVKASVDESAPIEQALETMFSAKPRDPDYFTPWLSGKPTSVSISVDGTITIDLESSVFASGIDQRTADLAIQQLIFTATAAAFNAGVINVDPQTEVIILVDGKAGYKAFGRTELGQPMKRQANAQAPLWIIDPSFGITEEGSPLTIFFSTTDTKEFSWQLRRLDSGNLPGTAAEQNQLLRSGEVVAEGDATSTVDTNGFPSVSIEQDVPEGTYALIAYRGDKKDPLAAKQQDSKIFTIKKK